MLMWNGYSSVYLACLIRLRVVDQDIKKYQRAIDWFYHWGDLLRILRVTIKVI